MTTEITQGGVTIVERHIDSAGATAKIEVRHGRYGYADENGGASGIVIDASNADIVADGNLFYEGPLQPGDVSGRTQFLQHQQKLLDIFNG
jgi:hypothetical protein